MALHLAAKSLLRRLGPLPACSIVAAASLRPPIRSMAASASPQFEKVQIQRDDTVGVTGYCMGGALSIASAVLVPDIDAVVAFYGVPSPQLADPSSAKAPVQAHFGELDNFVGFSDVTAAKSLEEKLKSSGVPYEVHIYPGCAHAFMTTSPEGVKRRQGMGLTDHNEEAVHTAWSRFETWMGKYLSP
ncbi:hypothetical protein AMTRI_Chr03g48440 [Amborella trichopoda]